MRPERFELPTYCSGGNRSIHLSYGRPTALVYMGGLRSINVAHSRESTLEKARREKPLQHPAGSSQHECPTAELSAHKYLNTERQNAVRSGENRRPR